MKQREILVLLLSLLASGMLAVLLTPQILAFFGFGGLQLAELASQTGPNVSRALLLSQLTYTLILFALPGLYLAQRWKENSAIPELQKPRWTWKESLIAWSILPLSLPLLSFLTDYWASIASQWDFMAPSFNAASTSNQVVEKMVFASTTSDQLLSLFTFVIAAALAEEWLFRGAIQRVLHARTLPWLAITLAGLVFALGHLNFIQWPFLLGAGMILGFVYWISGRLWVSMGAHVLHNAMTYFFTLEAGRNQYGNMESSSPIWMILGSGIATIFLIISLWRKTRNSLKRQDSF